MSVKSSSRNDLVAFISMIVATAVYLNLDMIHFQPLSLWAKTLPPMLLFMGAIGTVRDVKALRYVGWLGIALVLVVLVAASFPTEDYVLGGPDDNPADLPRTVSHLNSLARVSIGLSITVLLFWLYRRLRSSPEVR
jgi:hypothetical protein